RPGGLRPDPWARHEAVGAERAVSGRVCFVPGPYLPSACAASITSAACPVTLTLRQTLAIFPVLSTRADVLHDPTAALAASLLPKVCARVAALAHARFRAAREAMADCDRQAMHPARVRRRREISASSGAR